MAGPDNPEIRDVVKAAGLGQREWWTMPAIVQSYDREAVTADIKLAVRLKDRISGVSYEPSIITVPVGWPVMFGGRIVVQGELEQGDEVVLHATDANILAWLTSGGIVDGSGPGRKLGSSWAEPRALSQPRRAAAGASGEFIIGRPDGTATIVTTASGPGQVRIQSGDVQLGASDPKKAVGRDGDNVLCGETLFTWGAALAPATGVPNPWTQSVTPVGDIQATSTEVTSS